VFRHWPIKTLSKKEEDFIMAEDFIMITCAEAASSLFGAFLDGGGQNG